MRTFEGLRTTAVRETSGAKACSPDHPHTANGARHRAATSPSPYAARPAKPHIIGCDFGTHSTKLVIRQRGDATGHVVCVDDPTDGYPWFVTPSLVCNDGGKLYFGRRAIERGGGTLYRSLKVYLLPPTRHDCHSPFPPGPTPDLLVACYLSWLLIQLRKRCPQISSLPLLNVAAPMDHIENETLKSRYLQIVQAAWHTAFGAHQVNIEQGIRIEDAADWLSPYLTQEVAPRSERRFEVLPETIAPLVSLAQDARMRAGMYMIVDMGAGTTEVSVNHINEGGADQRVLCYADQSIVLGGDDFSFVDQLQIQSFGKANTEHRRLLDSLNKLACKVWYTGYMKDQRNHVARNRWSELTILLTGGGGQRSDVEKVIKTAYILKPWPHRNVENSVKWHVPTNIDFSGQREFDSWRNVALVAVAHGLSIERNLWPISYKPTEIEPPPPTEVITSRKLDWCVD